MSTYMQSDLWPWHKGLFLTIYCSINPILIQGCTARVKTVLIYFFYDLESSLFSNGSRSWLKHGSEPSSFIPWALPQLYVLLTSHSVAMPMMDLGWESGRLDFWRLKLFVSWAGDGFGVGGWGRPWKQCCSQRRHLQTGKKWNICTHMLQMASGWEQQQVKSRI